MAAVCAFATQFEETLTVPISSISSDNKFADELFLMLFLLSIISRASFLFPPGEKKREVERRQLALLCRTNVTAESMSIFFDSLSTELSTSTANQKKLPRCWTIIFYPCPGCSCEQCNRQGTALSRDSIRDENADASNSLPGLIQFDLRQRTSHDG